MESEPSQNLRKWLRNFARGQDAEASFKQIGAHLNRLIFRTAYRKSNNHELAKDVTQAVLLIIAKKAPSLSKHPAILGWVHKTSRTETLRMMRSHARRKQREEDAMEHLERSPETNRELLEVLDESMTCLSTSEKELVLMKYFEDRTYQAITASTGRSESAEKMRLKRALEKMSHWLGRKGIALSITGLGSLLSIEMAKGAPVITMNTTAAISALQAGNGIVQALATMSPSKLALGTGLLVLAGAAQPLSSAWKELQEIRETRAQIESPISGSDKSRSSSARERKKTETVAEIIDGLTHLDKNQYGTEELGLKLADAITYNDQVLLHKIDQILEQFDLNELGKLMKTINAQQQTWPPIDFARHVMKYLPKDWGPAERINWTLTLGLHERVASDIFFYWLYKDRTAAREWLVKSTKSGALEIKGTHNDPEGALWECLVLKLIDDEARDLMTELFLSIPEAKRKHLSHYRDQRIPRSVIFSKNGPATAVKIIQGIDDSSERAWIHRLVRAKKTPRALANFEQKLNEWGFNEIEKACAMAFFKKEKMQ